MSIQEPPRFTPTQVLEAGRRAEAEGRIEFAEQFYGHLSDTYPGSPEAAVAQAGLARLRTGSRMNGAAPHRPPPAAPASAQQFPLPPAFEPSRSEPMGAPPPPALSNPFEAPRPPEPSFAPRPAHHQPPPSERLPEPHGELSLELPSLRRDYRTGRLLARVFSWLGGIVAVLGLVLVPLAIVNPRGMAVVPVVGAWLASPIVGLWLLAGGLFQVMIGQLVRAVLDHANAARDIAAITRAEAEARYGQPRRNRRR